MATEARGPARTPASDAALTPDGAAAALAAERPVDRLDRELRRMALLHRRAVRRAAGRPARAPGRIVPASSR
ncbi:hypothetical protein GXB85_14735 [Cellulomonas sp. APG4]|uniref:hypothetical protein n=1 Tax=Cellulomonas sp. APG4 TaxID=1538656 RepID=UPI00137ABC19|nr:hypothetical protein [Cellulomonas sp. APG4]NCT92198.1 hypothetical protein [Cellulomonas sp. APG4]